MVRYAHFVKGNAMYKDERSCSHGSPSKTECDSLVVWRYPIFDSRGVEERAFKNPN